MWTKNLNSIVLLNNVASAKHFSNVAKFSKIHFLPLTQLSCRIAKHKSHVEDSL